jgi:signal transduction histidine kinase
VLAREEERRRLRRDLHDGLGPALAGLTLKSETAQALLPPEAEAARRQLRDLTIAIRRTVLDVRRVVEGLRPPALDELGLVVACEQAVERLGAAANVHATTHCPRPLPPLPAAVEVAAYRIIVEAVTNIAKHAQANRCDVTITREFGQLVVTVTDDGVGIATSSRDGHGLAIMRERAEELGGHTIVTEQAPGMRVEAWLPITVTTARPAVGIDTR